MNTALQQAITQGPQLNLKTFKEYYVPLEALLFCKAFAIWGIDLPFGKFIFTTAFTKTLNVKAPTCCISH